MTLGRKNIPIWGEEKTKVTERGCKNDGKEYTEEKTNKKRLIPTKWIMDGALE